MTKHPIQKQSLRSNDFDSADVLIALPVFNELEYIDDVLRAVCEYANNILVVDDGSTDGSSELLNRHEYLHLISHKRNFGYGQCLIEAFDFANNHDFKWIITIDCDYQHEPSYIPHFYCEIEKDNADIISGSRYLRKMDSGFLPPPAERIAINRKITLFLNENLELNLTDAFCGFKAYRTSAISKLELTEKGYRMPLQLWIRACRAGLRIHEIPVPLVYHDPNRKFCGPLENPENRMNYYLEIIGRELGYNVSRNIEDNFYS